MNFCAAVVSFSMLEQQQSVRILAVQVDDDIAQPKVLIECMACGWPCYRDLRAMMHRAAEQAMGKPVNPQRCNRCRLDHEKFAKLRADLQNLFDMLPITEIRGCLPKIKPLFSGRRAEA